MSYNIIPPLNVPILLYCTLSVPFINNNGDCHRNVVISKLGVPMICLAYWYGRTYQPLLRHAACHFPRHSNPVSGCGDIAASRWPGALGQATDASAGVRLHYA
jgi:hypothetical protein